jgi:hypothetical protein
MGVILCIHRYLAVAVGLLMSLWCLSGFVMMYQSFPALSDEQRLNGLEPLALQDCCRTGVLDLDALGNVGNFRIEMLLGEPVLRLAGRPAIALSSGAPVAQLTGEQILQVARTFADGNDIGGDARAQGIVDIDQWTLQSARRNAPAWHVRFDDAAGTEIYINGSTGEVFQFTNRRERVLSWFGAIPHWLYPTVLRQNGPLWTEVVIWSSVVGTFLAATGLYVGIARLRRGRSDGKLGSPYNGWWYWHHVSGLVFGVLVLTWVFSGLMTMNPWGTLSNDGGRAYRGQLAGDAGWDEFGQFLAALPAPGNPVASRADVVQLTPALFGGQLHVMARTVNGDNLRLNSRGDLAPLDAERIRREVAALGVPLLESGLLHAEDNYYYGHKWQVSLPVYRAIVDDAERTRLYINLETGSVRAIDSTGRWSRWIRTGLHDLDFPIVRLRPLWDLVVIPLLLGVTLVCVTGTWMALRRVRRDFRALLKVGIPQPLC